MKPYFLIIICSIYCCAQAVYGGKVTALVEGISEENSIYEVSVIDSEIKAIESGEKPPKIIE